MQPIQFHARTLKGGVAYKGNRKKHKGSKTFKRKKRKKTRAEGGKGFAPRTPSGMAELERKAAWAKELEKIAAAKETARSSMGRKRSRSL